MDDEKGGDNDEAMWHQQNSIKGQSGAAGGDVAVQVH